MEQVFEVLPQLVAVNEIGNLEVGRSAFAIDAEIECAPLGGLATIVTILPKTLNRYVLFMMGRESQSGRFTGIGELRAGVRRQLSGQHQRAEADKCDADKCRQEIQHGYASMILCPS